MDIKGWFKNLFSSDDSKDHPQEAVAWLGDGYKLTPSTPPPKPKFHVPTIKGNMLVAEAERWIGIRENGSNNSGQMVQEFQKAVDGKAVGEPWCLSFVQFCVIAVDALSHSTGIKELQPAAEIYPTEHCLDLWNHTPEKYRSKNPVLGGLVIWQWMSKDGKGTSSGHVGIVAKVNSDQTFDTIEGNTSASGGNVNREGEGVFAKNRSPRGAGRMKVKGFIRLWV